MNAKYGEVNDTKRIERMMKYKKQKFVYYALKHPVIFIRVYEESRLDAESFCEKYEVNYKKVWPRLVRVIYDDVPLKVINMIREEIRK